ncbi:MAG TPA: PEP-CTERM sorting domain-containing protein [Candidatus Eisenbacteria bacterium]|nr:PEP-CTERM sorting domain-containing protein [Candidatus Eisenbacteria bacterium]
MIWTNTNLIQSSGTGVIEPFLRWQNNDTETGMNTDVPPPYDTKAGIWTHSITLGQLGIVNRDGVDYYVFTLDINEPNQDAAFLTLNEMRIYTSSAGGSLADEPDVIANGTLRYNLDGTSDQTIYTDYRVSNTGSGESDVDFYIPTSFFAGAASTDNVYFVVNSGLAGDTTGLDSADGFEEVRAFFGTTSSSSTTSSSTSSTTSTTSTAPEPGTIALFGMGLIGLAAARRKK